MLTDIFNNPIDSLFYICILVIAISVHEFAHAWTAYYLGDPTPMQQGRVSINPLKHLDPIGCIFFLLAGFGWGKPVITNPNYYARPKIDYAITSLAGPFANLLLAIACSLPRTILIITGQDTSQYNFLQITELAYQVNLLLLVFNLLPIFPLDGSKLIMLFIKKQTTLQKFIDFGPKLLFLILLINYWIPIFSWLIYALAAIFAFFIRGLPTIFLT